MRWPSSRNCGGSPRRLISPYSNGPSNGTFTAYLLGFGQSINDSFVLSSASTVTGVDFGAWTNPGDSVTSVQWSIGIQFPGGNTYSGIMATIDSFVTIGYGFYAVEKRYLFDSECQFGCGHILSHTRKRRHCGQR